MDIEGVNRLAERLYVFVSERAEGVTQESLKASGWDQQQTLSAANVLLSHGRLTITQVSNGQLLYQAVEAEQAAKLRGLSREHMAVHQAVEKAGSRGIRAKTLRDQTGLMLHLAGRICKDLCARQLIKEVKTIQGKGMKVFMLFDTEPDKDLSGGTWYSDGEFNQSWVESLRRFCIEFLESNAGRVVSLLDLLSYVQQQPGPSVPTQDDVQHIMRTLELDEEVYALPATNGIMVYALRSRGGMGGVFDVFSGRLPSFATGLPKATDSLVVPCAICPLTGECHVGGRVSPQTCGYMTEWLVRESNVKKAADAAARQETKFEAAKPKRDSTATLDW